ncbi:hypothetical protein BC828DRAFT_180223 [Blastocladiella britannica]|nr:hypothetical protein BC828DRAFT_180223 [Blastocladiella britannica]
MTMSDIKQPIFVGAPPPEHQVVAGSASSEPTLVNPNVNAVTIDRVVTQLSCERHLELLAIFERLHGATELTTLGYYCQAELRYTAWMRALATTVVADPTGIITCPPLPPIDVAAVWASHMVYISSMAELEIIIIPCQSNSCHRSHTWTICTSSSPPAACTKWPCRLNAWCAHTETTRTYCETRRTSTPASPFGSTRSNTMARRLRCRSSRTMRRWIHYPTVGPSSALVASLRWPSRPRSTSCIA